MARTVLTGRKSASRKTASIVKRMKQVWIVLHRRMRSPSPSGSESRPSNPRIRARRRLATATRTPSITGGIVRPRYVRCFGEAIASPFLLRYREDAARRIS
jgi:hypothetical protein